MTAQKKEGDTIAFGIPIQGPSFPHYIPFILSDTLPDSLKIRE